MVDNVDLYEDLLFCCDEKDSEGSVQSGLTDEVYQLTSVNKQLEETNKALKRNISCLFKTAKLEIQTKNKEIETLSNRIATLQELAKHLSTKQTFLETPPTSDDSNNYHLLGERKTHKDRFPWLQSPKNHSPVLKEHHSPRICKEKSPRIDRDKSPRIHRDKSPKMHREKLPMTLKDKSPRVHSAKPSRIHKDKWRLSKDRSDRRDESPTIHKSPQAHKDKLSSDHLTEHRKRRTRKCLIEKTKAHRKDVKKNSSLSCTSKRSLNDRKSKELKLEKVLNRNRGGKADRASKNSAKSKAVLPQPSTTKSLCGTPDNHVTTDNNSNISCNELEDGEILSE